MGSTLVCFVCNEPTGKGPAPPLLIKCRLGLAGGPTTRVVAVHTSVNQDQGHHSLTMKTAVSGCICPTWVVDPGWSWGLQAFLMRDHSGGICHSLAWLPTWDDMLVKIAGDHCKWLMGMPSACDVCDHVISPGCEQAWQFTGSSCEAWKNALTGRC